MSAAPAPIGLRPLLATLGYGALVLLLLAIAASAILGLMDRRAAVDEAAATLEQLQGRGPRAGGAAGDGAAPSGSPFLDGPTVTIAGAALMQRLSDAVAHADGHITSSRVELQDTPFGPDFIAVSASLDIAPDDLQKLLYDLESGQPFLFVGQLTARPADAGRRGRAADASEGDPQRLQATLTVYGQWRGTP
ncbi:type II secretion system protein GspM [Xanthobacter sediminis]